MKSRITADFIELYRQLPEQIRKVARKNYQIWKDNPDHPGLQFKRIQTTDNIHSVRVGIGYRAIGYVEGERITWFWIGSHADYDRLLRELS